MECRLTGQKFDAHLCVGMVAGVNWLDHLSFARSRFRRAGILLLLAAGWVAPACRAESPASQPADAPLPNPAFTPFRAGNLYGSLSFEFFGGVTSGGEENFYSGVIGLQYYLKDRFAVIAEVPVSYISQTGDNAVATGGQLIARYHLGSIDRCTYYIDGGAGFLFASQNTPINGTHFNFREYVGLGATYPLSDRLMLEVGTRLAHLSNAQIEGARRNPAIHLAVEGYVGLAWRF